MRLPAVMACAVLATAGASAAIPLFPKHPQVARHRSRAGDWQLDLARNGFSASLECRLRAGGGRAIFRSGAVGFRFRSGWDVGRAVYRVDGGPPRSWRDDLPELIRLSAPVDSGGLDNPSAGVVWIPFRLLADANSVAIQPRPDRRARTVHLRGLKGLLVLARERGCVPDSRFGP